MGSLSGLIEPLSWQLRVYYLRLARSRDPGVRSMSRIPARRHKEALDWRKRTKGGCTFPLFPRSSDRAFMECSLVGGPGPVTAVAVRQRAAAAVAAVPSSNMPVARTKIRFITHLINAVRLRPAGASESAWAAADYW